MKFSMWKRTYKKKLLALYKRERKERDEPQFLWSENVLKA